MHPKNTILLIILYYLFVITAQGKPTNSTTTYSPWLTAGRRIKNHRFMGCRLRPWICDQDNDSPRIRRRCCRNRCVDVNSDVHNCGLCGIRCRFTWQCCRGICVNTNRNPFHCGRCENRCRFPSLCIYGLCGYDQPFPPRPWPKPCPPKPFRPPRGGHGPRPPKPFRPPRGGRGPRPPPPPG